jgi:hypothetical protein
MYLTVTYMRNRLDVLGWRGAVEKSRTTPWTRMLSYESKISGEHRGVVH